MESSNPESESDEFFDGPVETLALGLAYVLVGIGLFYRENKASASGLDPEGETGN